MTVYEKCINCNEGEYLVLAGPGTGKTHTIKNRIIHLVKDLHINPEEILCLTFTKTGAEEMNRRFEENNIFGVEVFTFHSFCSSLIESNPEDFDLPSNFTLVSDATKISIIKDCLDSIGENDQKLFSNAMNVLEKIKRTRITKEQYEKNLSTNSDWDVSTVKGKDKEALEKRIENTKVYWKLFELYCEKTKPKGLIDFNDLINSVLDRFSHDSSFLSEVSQKYKYFLVDEYQDTNEPQNELVLRLGKTIGNVFVVGDDDQMIYGFQGASSKTMGDFIKHFPETKIFCLTDNYRSNQKILNLAEKIASQDSSRLANSTEFLDYNISKKLTSVYDKELNGELVLTKYQTPDQEKHKTTASIKKIYKSGMEDLSKIAVIVPTNAEAKQYSQLLNQIDVPSQISSGRSIFTIHAVSVLLHYLQALSDPVYYSGSFLMTLRSKPFEFTPEEFNKVRIAISNNKNAIDALKALCGDSDKQIKDFIDCYDYLQTFRASESLHNSILEAAGKTGILKFYTEDSPINKTENIAGLKKFMEIADEFSKIRNTQSLELFISYLSKLSSTGSEINIDGTDIALNAIQIMTYHTAKGLQFDYVFMPGLESSSFESSNKSVKDIFPFFDKALINEKELKRNDCIRRLFVGVTRAKRYLYMSYSKKLTGIINGIDMDGLVENRVAEQYTSADQYWDDQKIDIAKAEFDYETDFNQYVKDIINKKSHYSATELNVYIACPRHYYLDRILALKGEISNFDAACYGTAIHASFEYALKKQHDTGKIPPKDEIIKEFMDSIEGLEFSNYENKTTLKEKGQASIVSFLQFMAETMSDHTSVGSEELFEIKISDKKFIGFIDRIDKNSEGQYWIYDYKTGKPKDSKEVAFGKKHDDYFRQLGMYKYVYETQHPEIKNIKTALLFPDGNKKDGFILEINYSEEQIKKIANDYKEAIENIDSLKFDQCDESNKHACTYCPFKNYFCGRK